MGSGVPAAPRRRQGGVLLSRRTAVRREWSAAALCRWCVLCGWTRCSLPRGAPPLHPTLSGVPQLHTSSMVGFCTSPSPSRQAATAGGCRGRPAATRPPPAASGDGRSPAHPPLLGRPPAQQELLVRPLFSLAARAAFQCTPRPPTYDKQTTVRAIEERAPAAPARRPLPAYASHGRARPPLSRLPCVRSCQRGAYTPFGPCLCRHGRRHPTRRVVAGPHGRLPAPLPTSRPLKPAGGRRLRPPRPPSHQYPAAGAWWSAKGEKEGTGAKKKKSWSTHQAKRPTPTTNPRLAHGGNGGRRGGGNKKGKEDGTVANPRRRPPQHRAAAGRRRRIGRGAWVDAIAARAEGQSANG